MLRRILFAVAALLLLLLLAEVGVTLLSQWGMQKALRSQHGLPPSLEVSIDSFPCTLSLLRNHLAEVCLRWTHELALRSREGELASHDYACRVALYDVELNMASLLGGKLELKRVSRQEACIALKIEVLNDAIGLPAGTLVAENGRLYLLRGAEKTRCLVKVVADNALAVVPQEGYIPATPSDTDPDSALETLEFSPAPMGAVLLNASVSGGMVIIEISVPVWEGYL